MQQSSAFALLCYALLLTRVSVAGETGLVQLHSLESVNKEVEQLKHTISVLSSNLLQLQKSALRRRTRIAPELDPTSDKKFFKKDYPNDLRPKVMHHFDHPFPTVQDDDHYDKDYVKDANDDGGEWKAQEEYDRLRNKLSKEQDDARRALEKEQKEAADLEDVRAKEKEADAKARAAEEEGEAARKKADAAAKAVADATGTAGNEGEGADGGSGGTLGDATAKVEKEVSDLEECKKQLAEAREKLKTLMAEKETHDQESAAAEEQMAAAEQVADQAEKEEETLESALKKEEDEHNAALKSTEEERKDVERTEQKLKAATEKLRKFRKDIDQDGGVYRSSTDHARLALVVAVIGLLFAC